MEKYRLECYTGKIEKFEIIKETPDLYEYNSGTQLRREQKISKIYFWSNTKEECVSCFIGEQNNKIENLQKQIKFLIKKRDEFAKLYPEIMEKTGFEYDITINVKFNQEEFDFLLKAFDDPMNSSYKSRYVEPGVDAFMNANKNYFSDGSSLRFTDREIDICCKVLELANFGECHKEFNELYDKMYNLHIQIVEENKRVNASKF